MPHPHDVSVAGSTTYYYDQNGNKLKGTLGTFTYTPYDLPKRLSSVASAAAVSFDYGPNRERIRRLTYATATATSTTDIVHNVGAAEIHYNAGTMTEVRRYLGPVLIVQSGSGSTYAVHREYFLTDAQGSTFAVLSDWGDPVNTNASMSFDPFGARRNPTNAHVAPWSPSLQQDLDNSSRHGYTGHEEVESVGVIHMNGRLYDPVIGRFMQPDPFVQDPLNSQSLNRFSYVLNNPMAFTDPTGYFSFGDFVRTAIAVFIAYETGGLASELVAADAWGEAAAVAFAGGFASGAVQTGSGRGALQGGLTSLVFLGVDANFKTEGSLDFSNSASVDAYAQRALASGIAGGVLSSIEGGRFGSGFASAGFTAALTPVVDKINSPFTQGLAAAIVGGTASRIAGGKFANGAISASFSYAFGEADAMRDPGRPLTDNEIAASKEAYPDEIPDYDSPRVYSHKWAFFQSDDVAMTPQGSIYWPEAKGCADLTSCTITASDGKQYDTLPTFIHEMGHVMQFQNGVNVIAQSLPYQVLDIITFGAYTPYLTRAQFNQIPSPVGLNVEAQADWYMHNYCKNSEKC